MGHKSHETIISLFSNIRQTTDGQDIHLDMFLENIRDGKWQDIVIPLRTIKDEKEKKEYKAKNLPYVTISGIFKEKRSDNNLTAHSGFICVDIDDVEPNDVKQIICADKHTFAAFTSASGRGLAVLFKINPEKHLEAFRGLQEYLFRNYDITIDSLPDVSRSRFVSFDPHLFINEAANKFTYYPKEKTPKKIDKIIYAKDDFERIIKEIQQRQINLCDDYHTWLRIGFSFSEKFGEAGRDYFHIVSQTSRKYSYDQTNKQYNNILKHTNGSGRLSTIATFYYHVKQAGIPIYSEQTKTIARAAIHAKQGGRTVQQAVETLHQFEGITEEESIDIIAQVYNSYIDELPDDNVIEQLEQYLRYNYKMRRNAITRYIENDGVILQQKDFNTIFIACKKVMPKINFELLERVVNSDFTKEYNPLTEFFERYQDLKPKGAIKKLFACIKTDNEEFAEYFGTKWLVGLISAAHGVHSPLMLILAGEVQNTGKTEFFRRLIPKEMRQYYGESKLDAGKDDEILMTQKWLIMDDEMGGKSKKDNIRLKELTSKQTFSLREPYGRNNVDLHRLAVLCGTSNDRQLISDPTGNRRLLPITVHGIDNVAYNKIDKIDVIIEAYNLYKDGYKWELDRADIDLLSSMTLEFEDYSSEYELITKYYRLPVNKEKADHLTATEIKVELEKSTQQRLSVKRIGQEMKRIGFEKKSLPHHGQSRYTYILIRINAGGMLFTYPDTQEPSEPANNEPPAFTPQWKPEAESPEEDLPF